MLEATEPFARLAVSSDSRPYFLQHMPCRHGGHKRPCSRGYQAAQAVANYMNTKRVFDQPALDGSSSSHRHGKDCITRRPCREWCKTTIAHTPVGLSDHKGQQVTNAHKGAQLVLPLHRSSCCSMLVEAFGNFNADLRRRQGARVVSPPEASASPEVPTRWQLNHSPF